MAGDGVGESTSDGLAHTFEISNEFGFVLPGLDREASTWGELERATVSASYLVTAMQACNLTILRQVGVAGIVERDVRLVQAQQEGHFVEGCRRLGITDESHAALSARYHALSNALGGLRMRYAIESDDKAWIFYLPNPCRPDAAAESVDQAVADFANWHARNGELLGNPGLVFVVTHAFAKGDYWNAGYWLDTGGFVDPADRCRFSWGERPPSQLDRPTFDSRMWPESRRAKVLQRYWLSWLRGAATASAEVLGDAGMECFRHGMTIANFAWLARLVAAFAPTPDESGPVRAARVVAGIHAACGLVVDLDVKSSRARITLEEELLQGGVRSDLLTVRDLGEVLRDSWVGPCQQLGASIRRSSRGRTSVWTFE